MRGRKKRGDGPGFEKQNMLHFLQNSTNGHLCWASPPVIHLKNIQLLIHMLK